MGFDKKAEKEIITMQIKTAPSVLACDMMNIGSEIKRAALAGSDMLHLDVMDGVYVPNLSFGFDIIASIRKVTDLPLDVHMMTSVPQNYLEVLRDAGADSVTVHNDIGDRDLVRSTLEKIRSLGMKSAIALRPRFSAEEILPFEDVIDMALVMTVEPGFGGQSFMAEMLPKIEKVRTIMGDRDVQVDGGIKKETAKAAASAGANVFVVGTASFRAENMRDALSVIKAAAEATYEVR